MLTALILLAVSWLLEDSGRTEWSTVFLVLAVLQVIYSIIKLLIALIKIAKRANPD